MGHTLKKKKKCIKEDGVQSVIVGFNAQVAQDIFVP